MEAFCYMDVVLTLCGNRLSNKLFGYRRFGCLINFVIRIIIVGTVSKMVWEAVNNTDNGRRRTAYKITTTISLVTGVLIMFLFATKREKIRHLIKRTIMTTSARHAKMIGICSVILVFSAVITFELMVFLAVFSSTGDLTSSMEKVIWLLPMQANQYLTTYPLCYVIVLKIITDFDVSISDKIRHEINSKPVNPHQLLRLRKNVAQVREEFEQLFNFIPFVLFGILFITVPGVIATITRDSEGGPRRHVAYTIIGYSLYHVLIFLQVGLLIYCVTEAKAKTNRAISALIDCIQEKQMSHQNTKDFDALIDDLKLEQAFCFTGWNMFTIDKSLILSFLSSVISFSVLLIQLESGT